MNHDARPNDGTRATRRVVLVTGASRGIGREIAIALARRGCRVAVHYRDNRKAAEATLADLAGDGHGLYRADLADAQALAGMVEAIEGELGGIAALINNAGLIEEHPPLTTSYAQWLAAWQHTIEANLYGPANLSWLVAQRMAKRHAAGERGRIVNISSRGAFRGEPDAPAYGASKAGLNAMGQSLARALAPVGIYVYGIAPGWVETDMARDYLAGPAGPDILAQHPLGRVATPAEVAATAVYCALDAPATMTGTILDVNGASYLRS